MWEPESGDSPDRLDASVWALTFLMLGPSPDPIVLRPQPRSRNGGRRGAGRRRREDDA